ncbi:ArsR/SmtB family transcription factor [Teichococcus oryzae]|uniref:Helix-turn-helix transcriptional regulator n=1 Tax=Teichococcus oryzae TaxID=1608942 RepID=A0A5B2TE38_9PROT|nr:helix-turn-helix transcriptional regulator [Pseudoroseomonas oryzae]KAA2212364.1 helix-turn-helix transcriptional regulator [Pseudoroseomonas oryzae]
MEKDAALACFGAVSQATRPETFRLLARHGADGLPAGKIARRLDMPQNTLSTHLAAPSRAGLLRPARLDHSVLYRADLDRLRGMMLFPAKEGRDGHADPCARPIAAPTPCRPTGKAVQ